MTPGLGESVVNNYYGDAGAGQGGDQDFSGGQDSGSFDPSGGQDYASGGFDPSSGGWGGGQDYSSDQDFSGGGRFISAATATSANCCPLIRRPSPPIARGAKLRGAAAQITPALLNAAMSLPE